MDLGIIGTIIAIVIVAVILRALRARFKWIDWIAYLIIIVAVIYNWIDGGFWMGLIAFFVSSFVVGIMFGFGKTTEVRLDVHTTGKIKCPQCNYGGMDIISSRYDSEQKVTSIKAKCKRCGKVTNFIG